MPLRKPVHTNRVASTAIVTITESFAGMVRTRVVNTIGHRFPCVRRIPRVCSMTKVFAIEVTRKIDCVVTGIVKTRMIGRA